MMEFSAAAPAKDARPISRLLWCHQRFGKPQVYALMLLAAFAGQCFWLAAHRAVTNSEMSYLSPSHAAVDGEGAVRQEPHSPVVTLLARSASLFPVEIDSALWRMLLRSPFILIGGLLGASLWYVARRLYGNAGGYTALALYAFSPAMIQRWAAVQPDVIAAWGTFGCIFTGIAVAHTLYAPRAVVLWNWRRILLLGVAIGLAAAAVFTTVLAIPIALAFMLFLAPHRKGAAIGILAAACGVGFAVWLATYSFSIPRALADVRLFTPFHFALGFFSGGVIYALMGGFLFRNGPAFVTLLATCLGVWIGWRKTRFFGTAAPLIVAVVFTVFAVALTHQNVLVFLYLALPFLFVFVAGVSADLLEIESSYSPVIRAAILATVISHAIFSIVGLARI